MIQNILVLGGTGFVGRAGCERLVERSGGAGGRILVPTRRIQNGQRLRSLPKMTDGRSSVTSSPEPISTASPSALLRK